MLLKKHSRNLTNMKARKLFRITFQSKTLLSSKKFQKKNLALEREIATMRNSETQCLLALPLLPLANCHQ